MNQLAEVRSYFRNQNEHHRRRSFYQECTAICAGIPAVVPNHVVAHLPVKCDCFGLSFPDFQYAPVV